jgi:hypothetical protein
VALLSISALLGVNVSFRGELLRAYVKRDFWATTVDLHALMQEVFVETMAIAKVMLKTHRPSAYVKRASKECHAQLNAQAHRKMVNHVTDVANAHSKRAT